MRAAFLYLSFIVFQDFTSVLYLAKFLRTYSLSHNQCLMNDPDYSIFHLKESEWRFNHRLDNLYSLLIFNFRSIPL